MPIINLYYLFFIIKDINLLIVDFFLNKSSIVLTGFPTYLHELTGFRYRFKNELFQIDDYRYKGLYSNFHMLKTTYFRPDLKPEIMKFFKVFLNNYPKAFILGNLMNNLKEEFISELRHK
jgi:hypothetical protein